MSLSLFLGNQLVTIGGSILPTITSSGWIRPTDWLPMPNTSSEEFIGLLAVYTGSNFIALSASGSFFVDWGDNTPSQSYASNATASYSHSYDNLPASSYSSGSNGKGNPAGMGYRQALVRVRPSGSNIHLNSINLQMKHHQIGLPAIPEANWLDISIGGQYITALTIGGVTTGLYQLERANINNIGNITSFASMFQNCYSLQSIPLIDTSKGTTFLSMFQNCYSLQSIPFLNTQSGSIFTSMFQSCVSLQSIPLIDTSKGTTFLSMFQSCTSLQSIPFLNTQSGSIFTNMFQSCTSLQSIPLINTSKGTSFSNMFLGCNSLQSIPLIDTSKGTTFLGVFQSCISLQSIPFLNIQSGSNFSTMFQSCTSLQSIPLINTSKGTSFASMFLGCNSLQSIQPLDVSFSTGSGIFAAIVTGSVNLKSAPFSGSRSTIDYSNCMFSRNELVTIFTNLGITGSIPCSITTSGNWGSSSLTAGDIAIATNKGWTIKI